MKTKKILFAILCFGLALCIVGCGEANTSKAVASNIDKKTQKLETIVASIEDINYDDIIIGDISPLADQTYNTVSNSTTLSKTKWYSVGRTSQSNANQVNATDEGKKIPNGRYVRQNITDKIGLTNNENNYRNTVKKLSLPSAQTQTQSSYKPKYINEVSNSFTRDKIDGYLKKIEIIYDDCADCISCNAECKAEKAKIQQNITSCKTLSEKLRDGTINLSDDDIKTCNNCLTSLNDCANRLNSTKNNVKSKQQSIMSLKYNFASQIDDVESAYIKLLEALENRLDCLQQCNNNLNCICDTINRTNVDMTDALKNKTNQNEIKDYQKNENLDTIEPPTQNNGTTNGIDSNQSTQNDINSQTSPNNTAQNSDSQISDSVQNNVTQNNGIQNDINNSQIQNNIASTESPTQTEQQENSQRYQNPSNNPYARNEDTNLAEPAQKANQSESQTKNIDTMDTPSTNKNDYFNPTILKDNQSLNNNSANNETANANNDTFYQQNGVAGNYPNGYTYGNGLANGYWGNGYGNGYWGNRPYPPRNIDTYQTIYKNIDTYAPYRTPSANNPIANPPANSGKNYEETQDEQNDNIADENQSDSNVLEHQNKAPIPNPFEQRQVEENQKRIRESKQNQTENENLNSSAENVEYPNKNTTMQNSNTQSE